MEVKLKRNNDARCANCPFWFKSNLEDKIGDCRFDPPKVFPMQSQANSPLLQQKAQVSIERMSMWPPTAPQQTCARHPEFFIEIIDGDVN